MTDDSLHHRLECNKIKRPSPRRSSSSTPENIVSGKDPCGRAHPFLVFLSCLEGFVDEGGFSSALKARLSSTGVSHAVLGILDGVRIDGTVVAESAPEADLAKVSNSFELPSASLHAMGDVSVESVNVFAWGFPECDESCCTLGTYGIRASI